MLGPAFTASSAEFFFAVKPEPKLRPRLGRGRVFTPAKTRRYEDEIRQLARLNYRGPVLERPLALSVWFYLQQPKKCRWGYPAVRPDLDNYIKAIKDALNGIVWKDDGLIVQLNAGKLYAEPNTEVGIEVSVEEVG